jgi:hypothetical protein
MARACPQCGAAVGSMVEECPSCGTQLPLAMPWWGWALGGFLVLLLFLAFADFGTLIGVVEHAIEAWQ